MTIRLLHAADLHLDSPFSLSTPNRVPLDATLEAFSNVVSIAVRERVDAVILAGDLYERRDRSIRARLHLVRELKRLDLAEIPSFIIHGNHDPLSADPGGIELPPSTTVFGATLSESAILNDDHSVRFRVQGISFHESQVRENLARRFKRMGPEPTIGVLHCNLGGHGAHADYAPCTIEDLDAIDLDYWALGHVHTRQTVHLPKGAIAAYPGNPQGRHVNETGARGCLLVELDEASEVPPRVQFVACDVVRWHRVEVDLTEVETLEAALDGIDGQLEAIVSDSQVRHHVARVELSGRSVLHRQLGGFALSELEQAIAERWARRPMTLESLRASTMAPLDVERIAASGGLAGDLAKTLAAPMGQPERERVFENAGLSALSAQLEAVNIEPLAPTPELVAQALRRALELVATEDSA